MTHDEMIAVIQAHKDGKKIQAANLHRTCWADEPNPSWNFQFYRYREAPTPTLRPWKPQEVPVGALLRPKQGSCVWMIVGKSDEELCFSQKSRCSFIYSMLSHEHSLDNGKTWLPCGVMEEP